MRLLLDTHALIWALSAPRRLPSTVAASIRDPENAVYVSAASTWEIAIKSALGKIAADLSAVVRGAFAAGFEELPITVAHTVQLRHLPVHHRDPFDRVLVAQAVHEHLSVVSHDPLFASYAVPTYWG